MIFFSIVFAFLLFLSVPPVARKILWPYLTANTYQYRWHKSGQPDQVRLPKFKKLLARLAFADNYFWTAFLANGDLAFIIPVYFFMKRKMFSFPVKIDGQFGLSVSPAEGRGDEILAMLEDAGVQRVNVRVYFSDKENLSIYDDLVQKLVQSKKLCSVTLVQNREAVKNISAWQVFVKDVASRYGKDCVHCIVGVAPNRIKWGIWGYPEYQKLFRAAQKAADETDVEDMKLGGPSVIDFEWMPANAILHGIKPDFVTHNLYVDVRGKPEDGIMGFHAAEKVCFLKAVTCVSAGIKIPLWLAEVNWPLKNQEDHAPAWGAVCVSEESYANYMARYMLLCIATGYVEQIFWWQLVARGYGLVDDTEKTWRKRPAFYALKTLNEQLRGGTFIKNLSSNGVYRFLFSKENGGEILVAWVKEGEKKIPVPEGCSSIITLSGERIDVSVYITVGDSPVFVHFH